MNSHVLGRLADKWGGALQSENMLPSSTPLDLPRLRRGSARLSFGALLLALAACPGPTTPEDHTWTEAFDASSAGWMLSIWGPDGTNERFAAGGTIEAGKITRFDGSEWAAMELGQDVPLLNWVYGFSASDFYVVGNEGTVLHYDGTGFERQDTPTTEQLWGIWGASTNDMWAVGGSGLPASDPVLLHYDGTAWTHVMAPVLPELERANVHAFFKVWGSGPDDVVVVGHHGVILRFDGTSFVEMGAGTSDDLISVWGTGPDRIVAVGGRGNGTIVTWDGTEWRSQSLSPLPGLNGVWTRDGQTVHLVGIQGTILRVDFDTFEVQEDLTDARLDFHAIFGDDTGTLTAVGGDLALGTMANFAGLAYERSLAAGE